MKNEVCGSKLELLNVCELDKTPKKILKISKRILPDHLCSIASGMVLIASAFLRARPFSTLETFESLLAAASSFPFPSPYLSICLK